MKQRPSDTNGQFSYNSCIDDADSRRLARAAALAAANLFEFFDWRYFFQGATEYPL